VKKNPLVTVVVWLAVQIVNVAVWIGVRMFVKDLVPSPWIAALVATGVTLPVSILVNLIAYHWMYSEHGAVVMWGLLGGLLIVLVVGTVDSAASLYSFMAAHEHGLDMQTMQTFGLVGQVVFVVGAPLFGLLVDRAGQRYLIAGGVLLTFVGAAGVGIARNVITIGLAQVGIDLGLAMLFSSLIIWLLQTVWSRRLYATVAGFYMGTVALGRILGSVGATFVGVFRSMASSSGSLVVAGLILLAGGALGIGGVSLSYALGRSRPRPEEQLATPPGRFQVWSLVLIGLAIFFAGWTVSTQGRWLAHDERWSEAGSAVLSMFTAGSMLATLMARFLVGPLADLCDWLTIRCTRRSWGRTLILILGALVMCGGATLYLASPEPTIAGVAFIAINVGSGMLGPSLIALVCVNVPRSRWGLGIGLYPAVGVLASLLSSPVIGLLADQLGIRIAFVSALVTAVLSLAATSALLPLHLGGDRGKLEVVTVEPASGPQPQATGPGENESSV
jgi:MFS family permease